MVERSLWLREDVLMLSIEAMRTAFKLEDLVLL